MTDQSMFTLDEKIEYYMKQADIVKAEISFMKKEGFSNRSTKAVEKELAFINKRIETIQTQINQRQPK